MTTPWKYLNNLFGGGDDPAESANQYLNQIPGVGHQYYDPYIERGKESGDMLHGQYQGMINDPQALIDSIMKNYKTSEGYGFARDQLTKEMGNDAAAGGVAGSQYASDRHAEGIQGLLSKDMQQYLQNALGVYGTGLSGEQGFQTQGYNASKDITDLLGGALNQQGGLAFQGTQQRNKNRNDIFNTIATGIGSAIGTFGGPVGTAVGGAVGHSLGGSFTGR